jgi:hypothetical protein
MIKKYNQFVSGKVNEEFEMDNFENEAPIIEEPIDNEMPEVEEAPETELPEEEGGEYQGQILLNQLASELGTEVDADGSINYEGKKINFYSETEKFHVDGKKFSTVEEVVNYLGGSNEAPEMTADEEDEMTGEREGERKAGLDELENLEDEAFESKSYRHTRLKKFGK